MTTENKLMREALEAAKAELMGVLDSCNAERVHHDGDEFHERLNLIEAALTTPAAEVPEAMSDEPALPEPITIEWPSLHSHALGCGVEDRGISDRYEAAEYGWQEGCDRAASCVPDQLFAPDQMRAYARQYAQWLARAAVPSVPEGWKLVPVEPTPKMLVALWDHRDSMAGQSENRIARAGYAALLTAAPQAPADAGVVMDAERLDWLLWRIPGDALRHCVGELSDTSNGAEFRAAIDAAMSAQAGGAA